MGAGRDCSPWLGPFRQPGVADGKAARTKEPAPAVGVEGSGQPLGLSQIKQYKLALLTRLEQRGTQQPCGKGSSRDEEGRQLKANVSRL